MISDSSLTMGSGRGWLRGSSPPMPFAPNESNSGMRGEARFRTCPDGRRPNPMRVGRGAGVAAPNEPNDRHLPDDGIRIGPFGERSAPTDPNFGRGGAMDSPAKRSQRSDAFRNRWFETFRGGLGGFVGPGTSPGSSDQAERGEVQKRRPNPMDGRRTRPGVLTKRSHRSDTCGSVWPGLVCRGVVDSRPESGARACPWRGGLVD
jgi:hypothetical protein